jgi:hypothetical protein
MGHFKMLIFLYPILLDISFTLENQIDTVHGEKEYLSVVNIEI